MLQFLTDCHFDVNHPPPPRLHPYSIMIGWKIHPLFLQDNLKIPPQSHPLYNTYKR